MKIFTISLRKIEGKLFPSTIIEVEIPQETYDKFVWNKIHILEYPGDAVIFCHPSYDTMLAFSSGLAMFQYYLDNDVVFSKSIIEASQEFQNRINTLV